MNNFLKKHKFNLIRFLLLAPIFLVALISISHVTEWYDIANPFKWAIYLSISVEVAAMVSILAFSLRMKGGAWSIFLIVTLIQMIGNIFYSFKEIDQNGDLFKSWVELTGPIWEMIGSDTTDISSMKRWLAFLQGGLLPIISLTSLHFFVKYDVKKEDEVPQTTTNHHPSSTHQEPIKYPPSTPEPTNHSTSNEEVITENSVQNLTDLQIEGKKVWGNVKKLREEGKLPSPPTEEELLEEPSALAFTPYEEDDDFSDLDNTLLDGLEDENTLDLSEEDSKIPTKEVSNEPESPNEVLQNALKKYKESKGVFNPPIKNKKTNIKRID